MKWLLIQYEENIFKETYYVIDCIFDDELNYRRIWCSKISFRKKLSYKTLAKYLENSDKLKKFSITKDTNRVVKQFVKKKEEEGIFNFKKVLNFYEIEKKEEKV